MLTITMKSMDFMDVMFLRLMMMIKMMRRVIIEAEIVKRRYILSFFLRHPGNSYGLKIKGPEGFIQIYDL